MHRLPLPLAPRNWESIVFDFQRKHPVGSAREGSRWAAFKLKKVYKELRNILLNNQHYLCAYCESKIFEGHHQIDHIIPKAHTTESHDYTLDLENMVMCCSGGEDTRENADTRSDLEEGSKNDRTCGSAKGRSKVEITPYILPEEIIFSAEVDHVEKKIRLVPDRDACELYNIDVDALNATIETINLNCRRLCNNRFKIWTQYGKEVEKIIAMQIDIEEKFRLVNILEASIIQDHIAFITTARLCVRRYRPQ